MKIKTYGFTVKIPHDALIADASQFLSSEKTLAAKQANAKDESQEAPWSISEMQYAFMKKANDMFEEWLKEKDGEWLQDHFEPKQPCRLCKHVNIDHDDYPCRECKHNPHVKRDE